MPKLSISLIFTFVLLISAHSQDRINAEKVLCTIKNESNVIDSAIYWTYDKGKKQWSSRSNTKGIVSLYDWNEKQNFTFLKSFTAETDNGDRYFILAYDPKQVTTLSAEGYVTLHMEFEDNNPSLHRINSEVNWFIITDRKFKKIRSAILSNSKKPLRIKSDIIATSYGDANASRCKDILEQNINDKPQKFHKYGFFKATQNAGSPVIRFRLPDYPKYSIKRFDQNYFEISVSDFLSLIPQD